MNVDDYLIDHSDIDWADVLSPWHWLLPSELTVWLVNRFGDLGGDYTVENTMVIPIHEHYSMHASIHEQIKDLPDGATVRIRIGRRPVEPDAERRMPGNADPLGPGETYARDPGMVLPVPQRAETITLIRWQCADSEEELVALALRGDSIKRTEPDIVFENHDSNWLLFNAAANPTADQPASRTIAMPIGELLIQTAFLEDGTHAAVVHKIRLN